MLFLIPNFELIGFPEYWQDWQGRRLPPRRVRAHIENTTLYKAHWKGLEGTWRDWNWLVLHEMDWNGRDVHGVVKICENMIERTNGYASKRYEKLELDWTSGDIERLQASPQICIPLVRQTPEVLRQMPKGGALHLHFASASSLEWVVNQGFLAACCGVKNIEARNRKGNK